MKTICLVGGALLALVVPVSASTITFDYVEDAGGLNSDPLNGLSARATFQSTDNFLIIVLENTSTGVPDGFDSAASLLVSIGMNLPDGVVIVSGDTATIGPGSIGLGQWSALGPGDSVSEEWAWTNSGGGDVLGSYGQIITTSEGSHALTLFGGGDAAINGPFGGIAADPVLLTIPASKFAVSDSIEFALTLSAVLTDAQLGDLARGSMVEFGSDERYLKVPEPESIVLVGGVIIGIFRRRSRRRRLA